MSSRSSRGSIYGMAQHELVSYVKDQDRLGVSRSQIRTQIRLAGWSESDVWQVAPDQSELVHGVARALFWATIRIFVVGFALVGAGLVGTHIAVSRHLTDTPGVVDVQGDVFWQRASIGQIGGVSNGGAESTFFNGVHFCLLQSLKNTYPEDFVRILNLALENKEELATKTLSALAGADTVAGQSCRGADSSGLSHRDFQKLGGLINEKSPFAWANSKEWEFFKVAVVKDKEVLSRVQRETGIPARILVSQLVAEQMRLFYSDRPWFERAISPLKVLGSMTKFSWGVLGLKAETAMSIERNLKNTKSPFYLGQALEGALDFTSSDVDVERVARATNRSGHYYACRYAALYNKQIMSQWRAQGFSLAENPGVLATLYNIGFTHSRPNANPQMGGAELVMGGRQISFGRLAHEFYYSSELLEEFPMPEMK